MKSLNKMIASAAAMATMCFGAKATEQKEVEFAGTNYDGGKIDHIELVEVADSYGTNTHLGVRSNAWFNRLNGGTLVGVPASGFGAPYMYLGTNTDHFARAGFAQGGATNLNQYVQAGNGKVYMTFNHTNGVYTTQITSKKGPGVAPSDVKDENTGAIIEYAIKEVDPDQDFIAKALLDAQTNSTANANNQLIKVFGEGADAKLYGVEKDGVYCYSGTRAQVSYMPALAGKTIEDFVVVEGSTTNSKRAFVLASDENGRKVYTNTNAFSPNGNAIDADAIAITEDKKGIYVFSGDMVQVAKVGSSLSEAVSSGLPAGVKSVVKSKDGKVTYYATDKKLGYIKD